MIDHARNLSRLLSGLNSLVSHAPFPYLSTSCCEGFLSGKVRGCGTSPRLLADLDPLLLLRYTHHERVGHQCASVRFSFPSPTLSNVESACIIFCHTIHVCHLLWHFLIFLLLHLFFHVLFPIFPHIPSSPPIVLPCQCVESISAHLGLVLGR